MRKYFFPAPILSLIIFAVWIILNRSVEPVYLVSALLLAWLIPFITADLRPNVVKISHPLVALKLFCTVFYDMIFSNLYVIGCTLRKRPVNSCFVRVPLDLRNPNGLAVLATIICFTPGNAWGEIAFDRSSLLVHVLDLKDEDTFIHLLKERYEQPLMEIFQ